MENTTRLGTNRTDMQMSPLAGPDMAEAAQDAPLRTIDPTLDLARIRQAYAGESDRIGSVPMPGTVRGMLQSGVQRMTGRNPEVLLDKLGERAAYERTGVRLYEAFIAKLETAPYVQEQVHLTTVRDWLARMTLGEAT